MDLDGDFVVAWESYGQEGTYGAFGIYAQRYNSAGLRQGGEFRVNTATDGSQLTPSVAIDASGDFIVAWQSDVQDGSSFGIYAQRYSALGVLQGSEFRVNSTTVNSQTVPSVAMDADGDFVVTWQSDGQDGSLQGVYAQRYNAAGVTQGTEFRVNTTTANNQTQPSVAMDANGDFVVAWNSNLQDGSVDGVYSQRYTSAGAALGGEFRVNTATASIQAAPSVAMDADGDYVVTWQSYLQDGSLYGVYAQRYDESTSTAGPMVTEVLGIDRKIVAGGRFSETFDTLTIAFSEDLNVVDGVVGANSVINHSNWQLTQDGVNVSSQILDITFDFNGETNKYEAVITFAAPLTAGTYQLTALDTIRDLTGNALDGDVNGIAGGNYTHSFAIADVRTDGSEFRVNTSITGPQLFSSTAMDADGDFVVTWSSDDGLGSGFGIYAQRYNASGVMLGAEFQVNTITINGQLVSSVAMDGNGNFVVCWQSALQDGSSFGIYAQRFNAAGLAVGPEFRVNTTTANSQVHPSVAMDAAGNFMIAWESFGQDSSFEGIYGQRYNAGGVALGTEFRIKNRISHQYDDGKRSDFAIRSNGRGRRLCRDLGEQESGWPRSRRLWSALQRGGRATGG